MNEAGGGVARRPLALVEDDFHPHASLVSRQKSLCNRSGGEGVCLDKDFGLCIVDLVSDRLGASSVWAEEDFDGDVGQDEIGGVAGGDCRQD